LDGVNDFGNLLSALVETNDAIYGKNHIAIPTSTIKFTIRSVFPLELGCFIRIQFPDDIKIDVISTVVGYTGTGMASRPTSRPQDSFDLKLPFGSGNSIQIEACGDGGSLTGSIEGIITVRNVVSPSQKKTTGDFLIEMFKDSARIYRIATSANLPTGVRIDKNNMNNSFSVKNMNIIPISDKKAGARTDINISFTIETNLYYDSRFEIKLPTHLKGYSSACSVTSLSSSVTGLPTCIFSGTNKDLLIIDNLFL